MKLLQSKFSYYICCCTDNDHSFLTHAKPDKIKSIINLKRMHNKTWKIFFENYLYFAHTNLKCVYILNNFV